MKIITIDTGTTNSRIYLIDSKNNQIVDVVKKNVGVKNTAINGSVDVLKNELSYGIEEIVQRNGCNYQDIYYIVAAGMITSNLGLVEVPHIASPCDIKDFATASVVKVLPEFFNIPCIFIPGMKNSVAADTVLSFREELNKLDVMRGEEVETIGLIKQLQLKGKGIMVLPGSHTKYVLVEDGVVLSCLSTLSGEIIYAVQKDTILSSSITKDLVKITEKAALLEGFHSSETNGLVRALYQVRLLQLFGKMDGNQRANFLVGAVLASDIKALNKINGEMNPDWIVVGGGDPLRTSFVNILNHLNYCNVIEATDDQVKLSTILGAKEIGNMKINNAII